VARLVLHYLHSDLLVVTGVAFGQLGLQQLRFGALDFDATAVSNKYREIRRGFQL